jgi:hypothetical protein
MAIPETQLANDFDRRRNANCVEFATRLKGTNVDSLQVRGTFERQRRKMLAIGETTGIENLNPPGNAG